MSVSAAISPGNCGPQLQRNANVPAWDFRPPFQRAYVASTPYQYEASVENQDNAEVVLGPDHGGSIGYWIDRPRAETYYDENTNEAFYNESEQ
jgi:hypothetical protein